MTAESDCEQCPVGTFSPVGSAAATNCSAGTYNALPEQGTCVRCSAGTYQDAEGETACKACTEGYFCAEGAAAALPCPAGTRRNVSLSVMTSQDDCIACGEGTFCAVGSANETACSPGTYNPTPQRATCTKCAVGT